MSRNPNLSSSPRPVLLISGSKGLAEFFISRFCKEAFRVSVLCRTTDAAARVRTAYPGVSTFVGDLSLPEVPLRWVEAVRKEFGRIDAVLNNAAVIGPMGKWHTLAWQEVEAAVQVDLLAPLRVIHAAMPELLQSEGTVLSLAGGGATGPRPHFGTYSLAKCALVRATENLALEYPSLRFYALAPGILKTAMVEQVANSALAEIAAERRDAQKCFESGGADPAKAAELAAWLLAERPAALSGCLVSSVYDKYREPAAYQDRKDTWKLRRVDEVLFK